MVEVLIVVVPLDGQVVLTTLLKRLVDWVEVLGAAHGGDPGIGWVIGHWVVKGQPDWIPHLSHFWVDGASAVKIGIDTVENVQGQLIEVVSEGDVEYDLQVGVPAQIVSEVGWR